jgi:hypothetical protein
MINRGVGKQIKNKMKKINISKLKKELENLCKSETKKTIVLNNAITYNHLIQEDNPNTYLLIQVNAMVLKQLEAIEKHSESKNENDDDTLTKLISEIKKPKIEKRNNK